MKTSQKGSVAVVLTIIIILLVVAFGAYIYVQNKNAQLGTTSQTTTTVPVNTPTNTTPSAPVSAQPAPVPSSSISVAGMQEYTDTNFGFSFWYPNSWTLRESGVQSYISLTGGTVLKTIGVGPDKSTGVGIEEFSSSGESITDTSVAGPAGDGSLSLTYFFNPDTDTWMSEDTDGNNHVTIKAADVSTNTMGGLHMLIGNARFADDIIIPLGANHFLVVFALDAGGTPEQLLAQTVLALNPKVATPTSQAQQIQTIQAEATAFGVQSDSAPAQTSTSDWPTYTNSQYGFSFQYPTSLSSSAQGYASLISIPPNVIITPTNATNGNIDQANGCYELSDARVNGESQVTINGTPFCLSHGGSAGGGQAQSEYYYTTDRGSGTYVTIGFTVGQINGCGVLEGMSGYQACEDFENNYNTIVLQPLQQSVGTLKFTQ